ncbi:hypothetical protein OAS39_02895, partial [Pirellulales bacterium]|nr:hypothetical protein [Pirellulales bacterium]
MAKKPTVRSRLNRRRSRSSKSHTTNDRGYRPLFELLEQRRLLSRNEPLKQGDPSLEDHSTLAELLHGLELEDADLSNIGGQVFYLDVDGAIDVTYNGPVTVGPFDVPAFSLEHVGLAGQEEAVIASGIEQLNSAFAPLAVTFTDERPEGGVPYSTIYVGGADGAFTGFGRYFGLAETVDIGNLLGSDDAFVFSDSALVASEDIDSAAAAITERIAHESAHLLGFRHDLGSQYTVQEPLSSHATEQIVRFGDPSVNASETIKNNPSLPALIDIEASLLLGGLDAVESLARNVVSNGTFFFRGDEYSAVIDAFLDPALVPSLGDRPGVEYSGGHLTFGNGSATVKGETSQVGFRNHDNSADWVQAAQAWVVTRISQQLRDDLLNLEFLNAESGPLIFPIEDLSIPSEDSPLFISEGTRFEAYGTFGETLAGGAGDYGTPPDGLMPDWRRMTGDVVLRHVNAEKLSVELQNVDLEVHDAFDFWPGNLGEGALVRYATTILAFLEINGRAADVPFTASWSVDETRLPKPFEIDRVPSNPEAVSAAFSNEFLGNGSDPVQVSKNAILLTATVSAPG